MFKLACIFTLCTLIASGKSSPYIKPITPVIASKIVGTLNGYRSEVIPPAKNMNRVSYNFTMQNQLMNLVKEKGPAWFFEPSGRPDVIFQGWNVFYVQSMLNSSFQFGWLDTCTPMTLECVIDNLHFRWDQHKLRQIGSSNTCFEYSECNTTSYNRFKSCTQPFIPGPNLPCSYEFNYYPWFIYGPLEEIACAVLFVPGPFAPPKQKNSLICFIRVGSQPTSDRPYIPK